MPYRDRATWMLKRRLAGSAEYGGWCRVIRTVDQGLDPLDETGASALAAATIARHAGRACRRSGARAGMGGRGLCHPQDGPLTLTGAFELRPGPGPAGSWGHERLIGWRCPGALPLGSVRDLHGLAPARNDHNGGNEDHGSVLRYRLGRRSPRHRPGGPGRAAAGPPPD